VSAVFIITLVLLSGIAYTIYRKQRRHAPGSDRELYAVAPRALFAPDEARESDQDEPPASNATTEAERRDVLLARATQGDLSALLDAQASGHPALYNDTLGALILRAETSWEELNALADFVCARDTLRGSLELSRGFSRAFDGSTDVASAARALHLAALSDDPEEFARVIEIIVGWWRAGKLPSLSAEDLRALVEGEFWVMSAQARASGAAFVVKQMIGALREELSARAQ
jgi:hypothetical protein